MIQVKKTLLAALHEAASAVAPDHGVALAFESPRHASHGDLAVTAAMAMARPLKKNPREIAQALVDALRTQPAVAEWVESLEIAGPGFINLRLKPAARQSVVAEVLQHGACFGRQGDHGRRVMVEFVSANPTGPLHVGHGRQGALGDALCNLLETQGWRVHREFYYNDAGVQIATLATSVQARARGLKPGDPGWPEAAYNGDYIADIAADFLARKTVKADDREFTASGDVDDLDAIRQFAVAYLRHEQDLDLQAFGVRFDHYYLESSLYSSGRVDEAVQRLVSAGKTYEDGGALWLRTTDYGDDKDRVMRKSATVDAEGREMQGGYTYFVPDVAYHLHKWERGFDKVINVQGSDHHGTIARVRAGLQAAGTGVPQGWPDYVLHKMVTVMRGGQEVKISKRAGSYVTLRDLIDWTSRDAVRFFLISRKADTEFTFDVDLALQQNDENPVFYVQYAHARICSVIQQWQQQGGDLAQLASADLSRLTAPTEAALMLKLAQYPEMLTGAAADLAPHDVAFYARDLAGAFHSYYAAERFLVEDRELALARLALLSATRQVLANALALVGVSAPARMDRADERPTHEGAGPDTPPRVPTSQRGGTLLGMAIGLLVGLGVALAVAMYVSKVPVPFVDKLPQRTAEQDAAESERNRNWNPNAPLSGKTPVLGTPTAASGAAEGAGPGERSPSAANAGPGGTQPVSSSGSHSPAGSTASSTVPTAAAAGTVAAPAPGSRPTDLPRPEVTGLFIQAGAYSRLEDAEQQRARLAMLGYSARISEREQGGRTVYRVRVGPFETRDETQGPMDRLMASGVEVSLVRVERTAPP